VNLRYRTYPISDNPYIIIDMKFTTLFFDLDDTLYPSSNGLWSAIKERIMRYMVDRLDIPATQAPDLQRQYYQNYGTTLRGLQHHHQVNALDFLEYVHNVSLGAYLKPDEGLNALLEQLPQRKWIFTNADAAHAQRVLVELQIQPFFEGIVDVVSTGYACKPEDQAYHFALSAAGESEPGRCIFIDDSPRNLAPARRLGFWTVLVGSTRPDEAAHFSIQSLRDLPAVLPELMEK
jgi:putative hydrolase of the HAD superfamily